MTTATTTDAIRAAFLADIIEHPECDDRRLIFADWLQDHGDEERAEFVRVQVALAPLRASAEIEMKRRGQRGRGPCQHIRPRGGCVGCRDLVRREDELIRFNISRWIWDDLPKPLLDGFGTWRMDGLRIQSKQSACRDLEYRRGFLHAINLPTATWLQHRVELVRSHPIQRVELTDRKSAQGVEDDPDSVFHGQWYWSVYSGSVMNYSNSGGHMLSFDMVGDRGKLNLHGMWSIHDAEAEAADWLSARLIARAKELAGGGA